MKVKTYQSAEAYLQENETILLKEEVKNSLILGISLSKIKAQHDGTLFIDIRDQKGIQLTGIMTPERELMLYANNNRLEYSIPKLIEYIKQNNIAIPGILGSKDMVVEIAKIFHRELSWNYQVIFEHLVYKLDKVKFNPKIDGILKKENLENLEKLSKWMHEFYIEAFDENNMDESIKTIKNKVEKAEVYTWENKTEVSMACSARPTKNGITLNYVFTPEEHRRNGYGTKLVAELSAQLLDQGYTFCTLLADKNNPTSNNIYTKIGYELICEFRSIKFEK